VAETLLWSDEPARDRRVITVVANALRAGEVVGGPGDTVYGLLALPSVPRGRDALAAIKGRDTQFLLLVASTKAARALTGPAAEGVWEKLDRVWPGPVTVILPAPTPPGTVALRVPRHAFLTPLLEVLGEPVISTSANRAGAPPARDAETLRTWLGDRLAWIVDGGVSQVAEPSTLVDLVGDSPRVLRAGAGDAGPLLDRGHPPP